LLLEKFYELSLIICMMRSTTFLSTGNERWTTMELFTQLCSVVTTMVTYKLILQKFIFMIMNIPLY